MKIVIIGNTKGDLDVINRYADMENADCILCTGDIGLFPYHAENRPKMFTKNNFFEYLEGKKYFSVPFYCIHGLYDNIAMYYDLIKNSSLIRNFNLIKDGSIHLIDKIRIAGIGGSYSEKIYTENYKNLIYKDRRHLHKSSVDRLIGYNIHILLMYDLIGGCTKKNIQVSDETQRLFTSSNPLFCFVGKYGWWGHAKTFDVNLISLPSAKKGYVVLVTNTWDVKGISNIKGKYNG